MSNYGILDEKNDSEFWIMRMPEILRKTGVRSRSTLYRWQDRGLFPKFVVISRGYVGIIRDEFEEWQKNLPRRGSESPR